MSQGRALPSGWVALVTNALAKTVGAAAIVATALMLAPLTALAAGTSGAAVPRYEIEVIKSKRLLYVRSGSKIEREYRVAIGAGGRGDKRITGDNRTPVGTYRIVDFNEDSRFELFMQLSYPNVKDAFFGYKGHLISRPQFDTIVASSKQGRIPPQDTRLGGAIGIHGIGEVTDTKLRLHRTQDWTQGCIALTNAEIMELKRYVTVGTKVVINE